MNLKQEMREQILKREKVQLDGIRCLIEELVEPYHETPNQAQILQQILWDIVSEELSEFTPLPFEKGDKIDFIGSTELS